MAKNSSAADRRQAAREKARQIAENDARREKKAKTILFTSVGIVVVAFITVVGFLIFQSLQPVAGPRNYAEGTMTVAKDGDELKAYTAPGVEDPGDNPPPPIAESPLGSDAAVVTVYFDFQCPACKAFEDTHGKTLNKLVEDGKIALQYAPVAFLDNASGGNKFSTRSANAAACVADSGQVQGYSDFVMAMFAQQPQEGAEGMEDDQIITIAEEAGVDVSAAVAPEDSDASDVRSCITEQAFAKSVEKETQAAFDDRGLSGTPRVLINGKETQSWSEQDPQKFPLEVLRAAGGN